MSKDRKCRTCRYASFSGYAAFSGCRFPEPQDGSEPPFMIAAAMPNDCDGGKNCVQYWPTTPKEPTP